MTDKIPSLADLIAGTPGAQTRKQARDSIKTRRAQLLNSSAPPPEDFTAPEPMPVIDAPDEFAKRFFQRLAHKETPPRGSKPRLVVDNNNTDDDDEPEPPKAA